MNTYDKGRGAILKNETGDIVLIHFDGLKVCRVVQDFWMGRRNYFKKLVASQAGDVLIGGYTIGFEFYLIVYDFRSSEKTIKLKDLKGVIQSKDAGLESSHVINMLGIEVCSDETGLNISLLVVYEVNGSAKISLISLGKDTSFVCKDFKEIECGGEMMASFKLKKNEEESLFLLGSSTCLRGYQVIGEKLVDIGKVVEAKKSPLMGFFVENTKVYMVQSDCVNEFELKNAEAYQNCDSANTREDIMIDGSIVFDTLGSSHKKSDDWQKKNREIEGKQSLRLSRTPGKSIISVMRTEERNGNISHLSNDEINIVMFSNRNTEGMGTEGKASNSLLEMTYAQEIDDIHVKSHADFKRDMDGEMCVEDFSKRIESDRTSTARLGGDYSKDEPTEVPVASLNVFLGTSNEIDSKGETQDKLYSNLSNSQRAQRGTFVTFRDPQPDKLLVDRSIIQNERQTMRREHSKKNTRRKISLAAIQTSEKKDKKSDKYIFMKTKQIEKDQNSGCLEILFYDQYNGTILFGGGKVNLMKYSNNKARIGERKLEFNFSSISQSLDSSNFALLSRDKSEIVILDQKYRQVKKIIVEESASVFNSSNFEQKSRTNYPKGSLFWQTSPTSFTYFDFLRFECVPIELNCLADNLLGVSEINFGLWTSQNSSIYCVNIHPKMNASQNSDPFTNSNERVELLVHHFKNQTEIFEINTFCDHRSILLTTSYRNG